MLVNMPNGDWINPKSVVGIRVLIADKIGPRVVVDTIQQYGHHLIDFDNAEAARVWALDFGRKCNEAAEVIE